MQISFKEIIKNHILLIPGLKKFSLVFHKTGILNDDKKSSDRCDEILYFISKNNLSCKSILEAGPGQNILTITKLQEKLNPEKTYALDTNKYVDKEVWNKNNINFLYKNTYSLKNDSIDLIYCYDVFEHVNNPKSFLTEMKRILSPNGIIFSSWDMRDHLKLNNEKEWFDMQKYSEFIWNLQMSNRSSYVNRLQMYEWKELFNKLNFKTLFIDEKTSTIAAESHTENYSNILDPVYRAKIVLSK